MGTQRMDEEATKALREEVLKLIERKEILEDEIHDLNKILVKNNVGMSDPLVDAEGYPLMNVDVYQVRHTRHLMICKQNGHKQLMKRIEEGIAKYYNTEQPPRDPECKEEAKPRLDSAQNVKPIAFISVVHPGSPADIAGIRDGDMIVDFGSVNADNFRDIGDIGSVVQHSRGTAINVRIRRGSRLLRVQLVPREWDGRGLLGCNVLRV